MPENTLKTVTYNDIKNRSPTLIDELSSANACLIHVLPLTLSYLVITYPHANYLFFLFFCSLQITSEIFVRFPRQLVSVALSVHMNEMPMFCSVYRYLTYCFEDTLLFIVAYLIECFLCFNWLKLLFFYI